MAINKVVYGNQTLIDLSDSTLTSSDELVEGVIAYDRSGNRITGTADYMDKVDNPTADKILIDDGNGQAQDSSVSIIDVALMSDVNRKQDVLTAGNGIDITSNTISVYHTVLSNVDLDTVLTEQLVYCQDSCTNKPTSNGGLLISRTSGMTSGGYGAQLFIPYSTAGEGVYYRRRISSTWTTWTKLENEITSTSGTVTMNTSGLIASASVIKEGGWVYVQMNRTGTTQFTANTTQAVGTLPEGFRPSSSRNGMTLMTLSGIPTYWTISSAGVLSLRVATVPATNTATYMTFYFPL